MIQNSDYINLLDKLGKTADSLKVWKVKLWTRGDPMIPPEESTASLSIVSSSQHVTAEMGLTEDALEAIEPHLALLKKMEGKLISLNSLSLSLDKKRNTLLETLQAEVKTALTTYQTQLDGTEELSDYLEKKKSTTNPPAGQGYGLFGVFNDFGTTWGNFDGILPMNGISSTSAFTNLQIKSLVEFSTSIINKSIDKYLDEVSKTDLSNKSTQEIDSLNKYTDMMKKLQTKIEETKDKVVQIVGVCSETEVQFDFDENLAQLHQIEAIFDEDLEGLEKELAKQAENLEIFEQQKIKNLAQIIENDPQKIEEVAAELKALLDLEHKELNSIYRVCFNPQMSVRDLLDFAVMGLNQSGVAGGEDEDSSVPSVGI